MPKVKIAPHLVRYFRMLDTSVSPQIRKEFRALLAVARYAIHLSRLIKDQYQKGEQVCASESSLVRECNRLERISKGDNPCPAK